MTRRLAAIALASAVAACGSEDWEPAASPLMTRWAADVSPVAVHGEYPRPMMRRTRWLSLNGLWDYAITGRDAEPAEYHGQILVPFAIESALSGVGDTVGPDQRLWYRRTFDVPDQWSDRVLLHFEAVDWESVVWVNGTRVGTHRGGYDPFSFDITDALSADGPQVLTVAVWDPTDAGTQPRGKQVREPGGIFYTSVTGIWQTVWLEPVPESALEALSVVTDVDRGTVAVTAESVDPRPGERVDVRIYADGEAVAEESGVVGEAITVFVPNPRLWSPSSPYLYDLTVRLVRGASEVDRVESHVGMRKISVGADERGVTRLLLNDEFVFHSGPLDQGYWPDGLYTAPTAEAMVYDLHVLKDMGFNMLRKHVKVEPRTFYAACDRLGLLVWQDMPNADIPLTERGSGVPTDPEATEQFERELTNVIDALRNHPSIVMWVPFNEGWGQYDSRRIVELVRDTDPTRLVNHASGWTDRGVGDVVDWHSYPAPRPPTPERSRAAVQGEFGGLGFNVPGHMWEEEGWGYALFADQEALTTEFERLYDIIREAAATRGLSAAVYTQTTDIETENNGLLTYDREVLKIAPEAVRLAQQGYVPPRVASAVRIFIDRMPVEFSSPDSQATVRYTIDGSVPTATSRQYEGTLELTETTTVRAKSYWPEGQESRVASWTFTKVAPKAAATIAAPHPGLQVEIYEHSGDWRALPDFGALEPTESRTTNGIGIDVTDRRELFGLRFVGYLDVPTTGVYGFHLSSDDGSRLAVDGAVLIDNDGIHGDRRRSGYVALEAGLHSLELVFFQGRGGVALALGLEGPGMEEQPIPAGLLRH